MNARTALPDLSQRASMPAPRASVRAAAIALLLAFAATGCAEVGRPPQAPLPQARPTQAPMQLSRECRATRLYVEEGMASWYGRAHHGRRTASGQAFNMHRLTAAHRTLPFGTRIRVTNMRNGRSVVLIVNDRGPFVRGRFLDVSYRAARELHFVRAGLAPVRIEIMKFC